MEQHTPQNRLAPGSVPAAPRPAPGVRNCALHACYELPPYASGLGNNYIFVDSSYIGSVVQLVRRIRYFTRTCVIRRYRSFAAILSAAPISLRPQIARLTTCQLRNLAHMYVAPIPTTQRFQTTSLKSGFQLAVQIAVAR